MLQHQSRAASDFQTEFRSTGSPSFWFFIAAISLELKIYKEFVCGGNCS
jgi:hypothetical protein